MLVKCRIKSQLTKFNIILYRFVSFLVSPMDYDNISEILEFGSCDTRQCTEIPIVDDMIVELTESFFVTLERTPDLDSRITLDPVDGGIEITDNDGVYYYHAHTSNIFRKDGYTWLTSQWLWWV